MSLEVTNLSMVLSGSTILDGVSLRVGDGERVGLIGSSGSGKSMLARTVMGLQPISARLTGSILVDGLEVVGSDDASMADLRGSRMAMIFQDPARALSPVARVGRQVELPLKLHYRLKAQERRRRVLAMLDRVGLDPALARAYPHQLSGGQQQRVAIAAALVTSPRLIVADEPTTALDSITQRQIVDLLVRLVDGAGSSLLFITHDFSVLARAAVRSYILDGGRVVEAGRTDDILTAPASRQGRRLADAARELSLHGRGMES